MKQSVNKKAISDKPRSQKPRKTGKKSKQTLYIKILSACLVVLALCFFAYFLSDKSNSSLKSAKTDQKVEKKYKDDTQKTIDDINRYFGAQDKNRKSLNIKLQEQEKTADDTGEKEKLKERIKNDYEKIKHEIKSISSKEENITKKEDLTSSSEQKSVKTEKNYDKNESETTVVKSSEIKKGDENRTIDKKQKAIESKQASPKQKIDKLIKSAASHESEIKPKSGLPKLVVIIDDVATMQQAAAIKSINLKLTPSIFPATKSHPDTPKIAKGFIFYMVHLPMQAMSSGGAEIGTLRVGDSVEKMAQTLKSVKKDFPNLIYINNHTGSKFTSDFESMDKFMSVAKKEGIIFMDSKTISPTKVYEAAKKHGMRYIARDVFLDHDGSKAAVTAQLKHAVKLAKERGYAIAIGHPHKNTLEVLRHAEEILKGVEVVYLKDIL